MKVQKQVSIGGSWAKVNEDFKDGDLIKILDEGSVVEGEFGARKVFKVGFKGKEESKNMSFNQTSINNLIDGYGDDTKDWVGKKALVFIVKQMVQNKLRNIAYLAPEGWTMTDEGQFVGPDKADKELDKMAGEEDINPDDIPF